MRSFFEKYNWHAIEEAPWNEDLELFVKDSWDSYYGLRYPCQRTERGWIRSDNGRPVAVIPLGCKRWCRSNCEESDLG